MLGWDLNTDSAKGPCGPRRLFSLPRVSVSLVQNDAQKGPGLIAETYLKH